MVSNPFAMSLMDAYHQGVIDGKTEGFDAGYQQGYDQGYRNGDNDAAIVSMKHGILGATTSELEYLIAQTITQGLTIRRSPREMARQVIEILDALASQVGESE